jgi:hypothetical protein
MKKLFLLTIMQFLFASCVHQSTRPIVYEPQSSNAVYPYYVDGNPVSAVVTDNSIFQSAIEHTKLASRHYMRMWVNYTNFSEDPILFDPMESFILTQTDKPSGTNSKLEIVYPSEIIQRVIKAEQAALITNAFIGMAEVVTTTPTTFRSSTGVTIQQNDLDEKINIVNKNTSNRAQNIADNYDHFARNMNSILIKKNTVFPSRSVSGYIYFYLSVHVNESYSPDDYKYKLQAEIADIDVSIIFKPVLGY